MKMLVTVRVKNIIIFVGEQSFIKMSINFHLKAEHFKNLTGSAYE
jgi:hypothetical protein